MVVYPAVFGTILATTGSYASGFFLGAVPALIAGLLFLRPHRSFGTNDVRATNQVDHET